jgi:4-amino-4-deoxy-L-arabinose transferase-like glycosyltransferase
MTHGERPRPGVLDRAWAQALCVLVPCALVYLPRLGAGGLTMSEGHRAGPAWEMLSSGDWLVPRLFGRAYLRKPPGMFWAIAGSGSVFGQTELAARLVSALAAIGTALVAWWFARRWFGPGRWAVAAGLAQGLLPWMFAFGRQAEIEALLVLATQVAALGLIDAIIVRRERAGVAMLRGAVIGLAVGAMLLVKGPAGLPAIGGVVLAAVLVRSWRTVAHPALWSALVVGGALFAAWVLAAGSSLGDEPAVTQGAGEFLWGEPVRTMALAPTALVSLLPAALALLFVWGPDARSEVAQDEGARGRRDIARALALATLGTLLVLTASGVSNPRYALVAAVFVGPVAPWVVRGLSDGGAGSFVPHRRRIARAMLLGHPAVWPAVLVAAGWVWIGTGERASRATSGREAGAVIAEAIRADAGDGPVVVRANDAVEARPEVLLEVRRRLGAAEGGEAEVRWVDAAGMAEAGPGYLVLRLDEGSGERALWRDGDGVWTGEVHKYRLGVLRGTPEGVGGAGAGGGSEP